MSANELSSAARAGLAELVAPLRAQLEQLNAAVAQQAAELEELRKMRSQVTKTLALLDPQPVVRKAKNPNTEVAPETLEAIYAWLVEHREAIDGNGGFSGPELVREHGFVLRSPATLANALRTLHEEGRLRLDHLSMGGAKHFKLVAK